MFCHRKSDQKHGNVVGLMMYRVVEEDHTSWDCLSAALLQGTSITSLQGWRSKRISRVFPVEMLSVPLSSLESRMKGEKESIMKHYKKIYN